MGHARLDIGLLAGVVTIVVFSLSILALTADVGCRGQTETFYTNAHLR